MVYLAGTRGYIEFPQPLQSCVTSTSKPVYIADGLPPVNKKTPKMWKYINLLDLVMKTT